MCNGTSFPRWQAEAIRSLSEIPGLDISLLIVHKRSGSKGSGRWQRLTDLPHLLWTLFNKGYVERRSRASAPVAMAQELQAVARIDCIPEPVGKYGQRLTDSDVAAVRSHGLDFIVRFGFGILKGEILDAARLGVWSYHHGDDRRYRGQPPGFWEIYDGEPTVGAILQRITEKLDAGTVLHRGCFRTINHSYRQTRDQLFLGTADWISHVARLVLSGDADMARIAPSQTSAPVRRAPGNLQMLRFLLRQAAAFFSSQWRAATRAAVWAVGTVDMPIQKLLDEDLPEVSWIPEVGSARYLADPFGTVSEGKQAILVEDYAHDTHRGVIAAVPLDGSKGPETVIDPGVHASYPYLFEHDGHIHCVVETYQARSTSIYRAIRYPDQWSEVASILEGLGVLDPTIIRHEDRWYLFCTLHGADSNTKLHVFHSESLAGPWQPHLLNPVKTDITSSRPAGTPFQHEGRWYRPAQNGAISYGGSITINRIDLLTPDRFAEEPVRSVQPPGSGRYTAGLHTMSALGEATVLDGRRDTFVLAAARREIGARAERLVRRRN